MPTCLLVMKSRVLIYTLIDFRTGTVLIIRTVLPILFLPPNCFGFDPLFCLPNWYWSWFEWLKVCKRGTLQIMWLWSWSPYCYSFTSFSSYFVQWLWLQCMIEIGRKVLWYRFLGSVSAEMEDLFSAILLQMLDFWSVYCDGDLGSYKSCFCM